jgi:hypothetical protein
MLISNDLRFSGEAPTPSAVSWWDENAVRLHNAKRSSTLPEAHSAERMGMWPHCTARERFLKPSEAQAAGRMG